MSVAYIPDGYHTITPYLSVHGVQHVFEFVQKALDASVVDETRMPDGSLRHAQVRIGDSFTMMGECGPDTTPMPAMMYMYVPDADAQFRRAVEAGAESVQEPADMPYGDRTSAVKDGAGNVWYFATHVEDVDPDEIARRMTGS